MAAPPSRPAARRRLAPLCPAFVAAGLVALAIVWVQQSRARPSYDAFGWMVWGRQVVDHLSLNTDGAPSWKPLTFLFTLPYALFGRSQLWLWTVTATAAGFSSAVFAARIAFRLAVGRAGETAEAERRPRDPLGLAGGVVGGGFAGAAVLFMGGFSHQMMIATSDPMVVALVLAAIDAHLSRRPRLAWVALVLASLGRPETWPFLAVYAAWLWHRSRRARWLVVVGVLVVPAGWFVIPGLTSHSWFVSGDLALKSPDAIHHHQLAGVLQRFLGIYGLPMQVAVLVAVGLAMLRRDRVSLVLAGAAALWVAVEVAFAYHGWPAQRRYMMEAGAVAVVLVGGWVGRALSGRLGPAPWRSAGPGQALASSRRHGPRRALVSLVGAAAVGGLLTALAPIASSRVSLVNRQIVRSQLAATRISRLGVAVARIGGPRRILPCGHPVTEVGYQSTLAWELGMNVGDVGYKPGREIRSGRPLVFFRPIGAGWQVHPIHLPRRRYADCELAMRLDLASGAPLPKLPPPPSASASVRQLRRARGTRPPHGKRSGRNASRASRLAGRSGPRRSRHGHSRLHGIAEGSGLIALRPIEETLRPIEETLRRVRQAVYDLRRLSQPESVGRLRGSSHRARRRHRRRHRPRRARVG